MYFTINHDSLIKFNLFFTELSKREFDSQHAVENLKVGLHHCFLARLFEEKKSSYYRHCGVCVWVG